MEIATGITAAAATDDDDDDDMVMAILTLIGNRVVVAPAVDYSFSISIMRSAGNDDHANNERENAP